jgi:hypothetical protein
MVDAEAEGRACMLAATHVRAEREALVPELRFARQHVRGPKPALLFADVPAYRVSFLDLGFVRVNDGIFARGFALERLRAAATTV